jgi:enamine deaminase RidA (YjgF/YER057c/UK114 family)
MIDEKLKSLGLELPPAPKPIGLYKPMLIVGDLIYVSGHGPLKSDRTLITGRLGITSLLGGKQADGLTLEQGQNAARQTGLAILATLKAGLGSLDRIARVVKLLGLVRCTDDFDQQPAVINGCSQLFVDLWGDDHGIGVRSALGTNALPGGIAVEIEAIFEIRG